MDTTHHRKGLHVKLPPKLLARLASCAKKTGLTKTAIVEKALRRYLKKKGD